MKNVMVTILCPACGKRLLSARANKAAPCAYPITEDEQPEKMDIRLKCPRCKAIVAIEK